MRIKPARTPGTVVVEPGPEEKEIPCSTSQDSVFRLKRILVPLDFSDCSKKALQYAISFARQFSAELTLLHVVQPLPPMSEIPSFGVQALQEAGRELERLRGDIGAPIRSRILVREGSPQTEIIAVAKELGSDLIILSTHGRSALAHIFLGSTAEKVARHAGCPVLIVRERERESVGGDS
jgi:nucleotide-binding universal stress UspA family protein